MNKKILPTLSFASSNAFSFVVTALLTILMHRYVGKSDLSHYLILQSLVFGFASFFSGMEQYFSKGLNLQSLKWKITRILFPLSIIIIVVIFFLNIRIFGTMSTQMTMIALIDLFMVVTYSLCRGVLLGLHFNFMASSLTVAETCTRLLVTVIGLKLHIFLIVLLAPAISNFPVAVFLATLFRVKRSFSIFGTGLFKSKSAVSLMIQAPLSSLFTQSLVLFMVTIQPKLSFDERFLRFSSLLPVFRWPISLIGLVSGLIIPWFARNGSPNIAQFRKFIPSALVCFICVLTVIPLLEIKIFGTFPDFGYINYALINLAFIEIAVALLLTSRNVAMHLEVRNTKIWVLTSLINGTFFFFIPASRTVKFTPLLFAVMGALLLVELGRVPKGIKV